MTDYQIQAPARSCAQSGRELRPGEKIYSVLLEEAGRFVRKDYAAEVWTGPPEGAFSFWAGLMPAADSRRLPVDDEMLMECLHRLESESELTKIRFRYVIALLLMRRKRLRFDDARKDGNNEILVLKCPKTGNRYSIVDPGLSKSEVTAVQNEVFQALGWR